MMLLDTHVLLWLDQGNKRLTQKMRDAIDEHHKKGEVGVSAISFWEVGMLVEKQRIIMHQALERWRSELLEQGLVEYPITGEIALRASQLHTLQGDPADRLIAATALEYGMVLVSADHHFLANKMSALRVLAVD